LRRRRLRFDARGVDTGSDDSNDSNYANHADDSNHSNHTDDTNHTDHTNICTG
jgi:hypothetical protein